jgi:isopenicillin-N epimerase
MNEHKDKFLLEQGITFLNHGSYGACPKEVFDVYQDWQRRLEAQPVQFLANDLYAGLKDSRSALSEFIGCSKNDIIFFPNPTTATTNIFNNLDLKPSDEVLMTNHEYGALIRAWEEWGKKKRVKIIQQEITVPLETKEKFIDQFFRGLTVKTRVIFISHISSATALIFPIKEIIEIAKERGLITIIDGAHAPGHIPLDIESLVCDFYTGAIHKWLCGPKGSSFLYVKKEHQSWFKPVIYSWGKYGSDPGPTEFLQDFQWQGTRDMSAFLSIPAALNFYFKHIKDSRSLCRDINMEASSKFESQLDTKPLSRGGEWLGQMVAHPLPKNTRLDLKEKLWAIHKIEIPIFEWNKIKLIRLSVQIYNDSKEIDLLMSALKSLI